jgi:hypothetical protein
VVIAALAIALLGVITYVRMIGMANFQAKSEKAEGKAQRARLRLAFVLAICVGGIIALLGELSNVWLIRDFGIIIFISCVPILIARVVVIRRDGRTAARK